MVNRNYRLNNIRVLAFAESFKGEKSTNLDAHIFEEYSRIAKNVKLVVFTEELPMSNKLNIQLVKLPKISKPIILRTLIRILAYSYATIKYQKEYDVVYLRSLALNFLISTLIAKKVFGKKIVFLVSESRKTHTSFRAKFFRPFLKKVLRTSDSLVSSSEFLIEEIEGYLGKIDRNKLKIVHEAVDTTRFKPENISERENILLTVARIDPVKGLENIINSLPLILKVVPDVKLKIVGSIGDKNYFLNLKQIILELGCEKSIEFIGPIPHEKLPKILVKAKIFVLTSKTEASSISTLEAMSSGLPVIVTRVGGMPSLVLNGINGFLVEPDEPKSFAEKVIELINNDSLRMEIGKNARETVVKDYSWENFVSELTKILKK